MAYVKNWLHCVWGTKNRVHLLNGEVRYQVIAHIKDNCLSKGIYIDTINGATEHLHCLLSLNPDRTLADVMQQIKGESSYWINKNSLISYKFRWAVEYYAASVSESHLTRVRNYIRNQERHHKVQTWVAECDEFMVTHGFIRVED